MKNRIKFLYSILSVMTTGLLLSSAAHAQGQQFTILSCTFGCNCTAVLTASLAPPAATTPVTPVKPALAASSSVAAAHDFIPNWVVVCNNETVYSGEAYAEAGEIQGNPDFGVGNISGIDQYLNPIFPSVGVDGDFFDFAHGFQNRPAHLYLNNATDAIEGTCNHNALPQTTVTQH